METTAVDAPLQGLKIRAGELLERDAALQGISDALRETQAGQGTALFLVGPAGIGKTSLIEAGRIAAGADGFAVGPAVGSQMGIGFPFGLIGQALVALGGSDVDDVDELRRLGGQSARVYRIFRWLEEAATAAPLMLALDDLHWADPDSLQALGYLARRLAATPILVLGSLRPEPDPASLLARDLTGSGHARMLALEPLTREASAELVSRTAGRTLDGAEAERLWHACAGTPLLLKAAAWRLGGGRQLPGSRGPLGLDAALLLDRFVGLGSGALDYVHAAAILGVRFRREWVRELATLSAVAARAAHGQLVRAGLLEDLVGGWSSFVHPLFAQALVEGRPLSEREHAHALAFAALRRAGAPDALAAEHAIAARLSGNREAIEVTARAGRHAMAQGAVGSACTLLGNAIELAGSAAGDALLLDYAEALAARARIDDAEQVCHRLLRRLAADPAVRVNALALLARTAVLTGRPGDAERLYGEAASAASALGAASEATIVQDAAITSLVVAPIQRTLVAIERFDELSGAGVPERRTMALLAAYAALMSGDAAAERPLAAAVRDWDSREQGDSGWAWATAVHVLNSFKLLEDFEGGGALFEREFQAAVRDGAPNLMIALTVAHADTVHRAGRPLEALAMIRRAVALGDWEMRPWSDLALAVLLTELGRDQEAAAHVAVLRAFCAATAAEYHAAVSLWLTVLDGRRLLAAGAAREASERMLDAPQLVAATGWRHPAIVPWAGVAVDAHITAGRIERAHSVLDELERISAPLRCRWPRATLALGRAQLAAAAGDEAGAERGFAQALALFETLPQPIARAEALLAYGVYLRREGRPREARTPLADALALTEDALCERVARVARAELAAAGGRRRRRRDDPSALTSQERRVAELAAQTLTNAEIAAVLRISPKTVGHHLEHVYAKLGVSSRRELIRGGIPPGP